jgi:hypothetical protein
LPRLNANAKKIRQTGSRRLFSRQTSVFLASAGELPSVWFVWSWHPRWKKVAEGGRGSSIAEAEAGSPELAALTFARRAIRDNRRGTVDLAPDLG